MLQQIIVFKTAVLLFFAAFCTAYTSMKFLFNIFLILVGSAFMNAQKTFTVKGAVKDFHDKMPLSGAIIFLGNQSVTTDSEGEFIFSAIPAGTYRLVAKHPECEDYTQNIVLNSNVHLQLVLEHHVDELETVTLHGNHRNSGTLIIRTLDQNQIVRNSTDNLGNLLIKISGVTTLKTGNSIAKPVIHGLYGSRIAIFNNGVRLAEQEWGVEHAPNVDVNNFQHIDVIKGASALKYGSDAIGGVIVLEPEIFPKKDTVKGAIRLSGISNGRGAALHADVAKIWKNGWAVQAGGSMKKLGDQQAPKYNLKNTGADFSSFKFSVRNIQFEKGISVDYALTQQNIGILRDSHVSGSNDFFRAMTAQVPVYSGDFSYSINQPRQVVDHHIAKISAFQRFENLGKITGTYSFQYNHRQEFDLRRGTLREIPALDLALMTHQLNFNTLLEREKWSLETGTDGSFQNNFSDPATEARRLIPNYDRYNAAVYGVFKRKINSKISAELGARYDFVRFDVSKWYDKNDWENRYAQDFPEFFVRQNANRVFTRPKLNFNNWALNAGLELRLNELLDFKLNYARVSRAPNIAELFSDGLHHSAGVIETGDLRLKNEEGHQIQLFAEAKLNLLQGFRISVNPYAFFTQNFINQVPVSIKGTIRGVFPEWAYQQVSARMLGADVDILAKITGNFTYSAKASYVQGEDLTNDEPLILMMPPIFSQQIEYKNKLWKDFYISLEQFTAFRQTRFPERNLPLEIYENGQLVEKTVDLSTPPPAYTLWNLQTGINLRKNFCAGLSVQNILNSSYREYLNRLRYFADEAGRNLILTFKYNF